LRTLKKTVKWIVLAMLVALAAAGGLMAWAAPPDSKDGVERNGVHEEIRLGSSEGIRQQIPSGSIRRASGIEARARLREYLKEKGPFARGC